VTVELVGIGFVVGSSFVQTVTESIAFALLALTLGLLIAAWGLVSKVRRRLAAGAVIGLAALVLLVGVPLVRLLPDWGGAGLWILVAGIGLVAVVVATMFEKGQAAVHANLTQIGDATADWE